MFHHRVKGESKLQLTTQIQYLQHLAALYWYKSPRLVIAAVTAACIVLVLLLSWVCAGTPKASKESARQGTEESMLKYLGSAYYR